MEETIQTEEHGLSDYVKNTEKGFNRLLKSLEKEKSKNEYRDEAKKHKIREWTEKPLHGQYPWLVAETKGKNTHGWIKDG